MAVTKPRKQRSDPAISKAKTKIADAIKNLDMKAAGSVADLAKLADSLAKLVAAEGKASDDDWGGEL